MGEVCNPLIYKELQTFIEYVTNTLCQIQQEVELKELGRFREFEFISYILYPISYSGDKEHS